MYGRHILYSTLQSTIMKLWL